MKYLGHTAANLNPKCEQLMLTSVTSSNFAFNFPHQASHDGFHASDQGLFPRKEVTELAVVRVPRPVAIEVVNNNPEQLTINVHTYGSIAAAVKAF